MQDSHTPEAVLPSPIREGSREAPVVRRGRFVDANGEGVKGRWAGISLICLVVVFCLTPIENLRAVSPPTNEHVVENLLGLLSQYHGMEFEITHEFEGQRGLRLECKLSSDGTECCVEKFFISDGVESGSALYSNRDYSYLVNRTPTNMFFASASTRPSREEGRAFLVGNASIFFLGRTNGGKRFADLFREVKPVVAVLPSSGDARRYSVTVESESQTEERHRFEVSESGNEFQLTSVIVEITPESMSARNGHPVDEIRKHFLKRSVSFGDIEIREGRVVAYTQNQQIDELPGGETRKSGTEVRVRVVSSQPLTRRIERSTRMFRQFEMPERIGVSMYGGSLAPHVIVNGSLVRLNLQYETELPSNATALRKNWFQKYWVVICCAAILGTGVLGLLILKRVNRAR